MRPLGVGLKPGTAQVWHCRQQQRRKNMGTIDQTPAARYTMLYRPPGFASLPKVDWELVEAPESDIMASRPGLPESKHRYGVFTTGRPLTESEMDSYQIQKVSGGMTLQEQLERCERKSRLSDDKDKADLLANCSREFRVSGEERISSE